MTEKLIHLTINGKPVAAKEGQTILEAAKDSNIYVPSLCYLEGVHKFGGCRLCMVEVEGARSLVAACMVPARDGMVVKTNSAKARHARKLNCELILSNHPQDCLSCARSGQCELQALSQTLGINEARFKGALSEGLVDMSPSITRDTSKCVLCRRCVSVCNQIQKVGVLNPQNRGFATTVGPSEGKSIAEVDCTNCGQCVIACPVNALSETSSIQKVWEAINNPNQRVVVQAAPAVRVAIGEEFGMPPGFPVTGKLATALKELMFDDVFDTNFAADLTVMEEGSEFLRRVKDFLHGGEAVLPMITSCSPGWVKFLEHRYPERLGHLSTCKSPHMMMGALVKSYYAQKLQMDPKNMFVVSVMPCTAKKFEIVRPELSNNGLPNVDAVITTRELADMIREAGIDFVNLPDSSFEAPMGIASGVADLFGVTGGVMEAALNTVYELVTGRGLPDGLRTVPTDNENRIRTAEIFFEHCLPQYQFLEGFKAKVAVASGFAGADILMKEIAGGSSPYHFIEIMGCPGGCVTGGGQPRSSIRNAWAERASGVGHEFEKKTFRKAHDNPAIQKLYNEFLLEPLGYRSHDLLHTHYTPRGVYAEDAKE